MTVQDDIAKIDKNISALFQLNVAASKERADNHLEACQRLTAIETKLQALPAAPERPCKIVIEHLEDHKENLKMWKKGFVAGFIGLIFSFALSAFAIVKAGATKIIGGP